MTADSIAETVGPGEPESCSCQIAVAVVELLGQGEELLLQLDADSYRKPVAAAFNASIGGHYRHCLDHFSSILRGLDCGVIDYDHRNRDPRLEASPELARELTRELRQRFSEFTREQLERPVSARCQVNYLGDGSPVTSSTLGRELVYAVAHGIHHFALIAVIGRLLDAKLPTHFGIAPSTLAHRLAPAAQPAAFAA